MTAASTVSTSSTSQLLADLKSTTEAVRNKDWLSAGLDGAGAALDILGSTASPLSAISSAGFGWVKGFVQFLEEPLNQLSGDASSVSSSSQGLQSAGQDVSSLSDSYKQASQTETTGWTGAGASEYRNASSQLADGVAAVGQAGTATSTAVSGAGQVVAQARQIVTQLIGEAAAKINTILTQAFAAAQATGGLSIAAAIPQVVQTAVEYGQKIAQKMQTLLSSSQNLMALVQSALQTLGMVEKEITRLSGQGTSANSTSTDLTGLTGQSTTTGSISADSTGLTGENTSTDSTPNDQSTTTDSTSADSTEGTTELHVEIDLTVTK
jgi:F0F1-type ATP synthase membrane subunit b/b'